MNRGPAVLVTGASGFVGSALMARILAEGLVPRAVVRQASNSVSFGAQSVFSGDLDSNFDWRAAISGCDTVVHAAARVHVMRDPSRNPLAEFRRVNVAGTLQLARQAAEAGVRRFVFLSSIKVNGEGTIPNRPFRPDDAPAPIDPYGISKYEAEQGLLALAAETTMQVVIIRPVLVYGPGVRANFLSIMQWLHMGVPLPLGAIQNYRSLVALDNLVDLIVTCLDHPAAANQTFLVSDGDDLSTTQLLRQLGQALGKPARLLPVPAAFLKAGATLIGKQNIAQRLCGSLQVDISKAQRLMNWTPPITVEEGLQRAAASFLSGRRV